MEDTKANHPENGASYSWGLHPGPKPNRDTGGLQVYIFIYSVPSRTLYAGLSAHVSGLSRSPKPWTTWGGAHWKKLQRTFATAAEEPRQPKNHWPPVAACLETRSAATGDWAHPHAGNASSAHTKCSHALLGLGRKVIGLGLGWGLGVPLWARVRVRVIGFST